jgi:hypothetical protein
MGKNWKGGQRGQRKGGGSASKSNSLASCRGFPFVLATCDTARERESNKEIVNLLTLGMEELIAKKVITEKYTSPFAAKKMIEDGKIDNESESECDSDDDFNQQNGSSMADLLAAEINSVKKESGSGTYLHSINLNTKGLVLVKILRRDVCPIKLLQIIFDKIKNDNSALSRHLIRLTPCSQCFYPNIVELISNTRTLLRKNINNIVLPSFTLPEDLLMEIKKVEEKEKDEKTKKENATTDETAVKQPFKRNRDPNEESETTIQNKKCKSADTDSSTDGNVDGDQDKGGEGEGEEEDSELITKQKIEFLRAERKRLKAEKAQEVAESNKIELAVSGLRAIRDEEKYLSKRAEAEAEADEDSDSDPSNKQCEPFSLGVELKARMCTALTKNQAYGMIKQNLPRNPIVTVKSSNNDVSINLP